MALPPTTPRPLRPRLSPEEKLRLLWPALLTGDPKAVHEARKLTRRATAELKVVGAPGKVRRAWRDLRRTVADLRDHDAAGEHLLSALTERGASEDEIRTFQADWAKRRERLLSEVVWPQFPAPVPRPEAFEEALRRSLRREAGALLEESKEVLRSKNILLWHEWRKHLKHYRYTLDLSRLEATPPALVQILDALGRMQDAEVVRGLLRRDRPLLAQRRSLLAREKAARKVAQQQVRQLWPELKAHLKEMRKKAR